MKSTVSHLSLLLPCAFLLFATQGVSGCGETAEPQQQQAEVDTTEFSVEPAPVAIRRVTAPQYKNIVHDLLGETVVLPAALEPDVNNAGLIAIGASLGSISARGVEQYEAAAYDLARQAFADDGLRSRLVPCQPTGQVDDACAEDFLTAFGASAWRRPLEEDEIERLVEIAGTAAAVREDFYGGLEFALAAILQSPNFLFRIEVGEADPSGAGRRFTDHEMASRLSFLLWNSTPDEALLEAQERLLSGRRTHLWADVLKERRIFGELVEKVQLKELCEEVAHTHPQALRCHEAIHLRSEAFIVGQFSALRGLEQGLIRGRVP